MREREAVSRPMDSHDRESILLLASSDVSRRYLPGASSRGTERPEMGYSS